MKCFPFAAHELRTAARDARWILPIPSLILLLSVGIAHNLWLTHSGNPLGDGLTATQLQARELVNDLWPYVGWVFPYALLKFPDLKNPMASWRTTPVPARTVYGARLMLSVIATVVLPTLLFAAALLLTFPSVAGEQTLIALRNQWIYFAYGAFAALVAPGHRGLLILASMAASVMLTAYLVGNFIEPFLYFVVPWDLAFSTLTNNLLFGDGIALGAPLILAWLIRRNPGTSLKPWIIGSGSAILLCALVPYECISWMLKFERLQMLEKTPIKATLVPISAEESRQEVLRQRTLHGAHIDPRTTYSARATVSPETGPDTPGTLYSGQLYTSFGQLHMTLPDAERPDRRAILRDYSGLPPIDSEDIARDQMRSIIGNPTWQILTRGQKSSDIRWVPLADLRHDNRLVLYFGDKPRRKVGERTNPGQPRPLPARIETEFDMEEHVSPEILFRCPAALGGTLKTETEVIAVSPMSMRYERGCSALHTITRSPSLLPTIPAHRRWRSGSKSYEGEPTVILLNPKRHQAVTSFITGGSSDDAGGAVSHQAYFIEVRRVAPLIDEAWIQEAEIVVYVPGKRRTSRWPLVLSPSNPAATGADSTQP